MGSPFITKTGSSIKAANTADAVNKNACIYQHTGEVCNFSIGPNGAQMMEFDYKLQGDNWANWLSFWINSDAGGGKWVPDVEIDSLELMNKKLAHNFAGFGHQTAFKREHFGSGHVTTWLSDSHAEATDCGYGTSSCPKSGDIASQKFKGSSIAGIKSGKIKHHLAIDYWKTRGAASMEVSNIRIYAGGSFARGCPGATPI